MASSSDKMAKRRMRGSYVTTVIGIALVLFMLGFLGFILLNADKVSTHVKENIRFQLELRDSAKDVEVSKLKKRIDASDYARSSEMFTKEQGAARLKEEIGEDFIDFLDGVNPIPAMIELRLRADYAHPDSIAWIVQELSAQPAVKEVEYAKDLIEKVNENMGKLSIILLAFAAVLLFIAIALINNTIRLAMYSKRFLIRSMQLVGATRGFIQRPFLWQGVVQGILGGIVAMGMLAGTIYLIREWVPASFGFGDLSIFAKLFGLTVVLGVLIAFFSTFFAVNRYIRMKLDDLY